jgi:hypothetical protein
MPSSQAPRGSGTSLESPRLAPAIDLPSPNGTNGCGRTEASPFYGISRYGAMSGWTEGFPRHRPPSVASSLVEAAGEGFAVMSGCARRIAPTQGNFRYLTRNFARTVVAQHICTTDSRWRRGSPSRRRECRTISSSRWLEREGRRMASEDSPDTSGVQSLSCWLSAPRTSSLTAWSVVEDPPGFPAHSRLRTAPSPMRGAAPPCLPGGFLP